MIKRFTHIVIVLFFFERVLHRAVDEATLAALQDEIEKERAKQERLGQSRATSAQSSKG